MNKKRIFGLIGLYVLLVFISSFIQQVKYYGKITLIPICITLLILILLWKYLLRHKIINVTWLSMTYEPTTHKSERVFLFSLVTLVSPILRFHDITASDVLFSLLALLTGIIGFTLNERRIHKKI